MLSIKTKFFVVTLVLATTSVGIVQILYAVCGEAPTKVDEWQLELVDITADGDSIDDRDEYEEFTYRLEADDRGDVIFHTRRIDRRDSYHMRFSSDTVPAKLDSHLASEGGQQ